MGLGDHRPTVTVEVIHDVQLPQRAGAVEWPGDQTSDEVLELFARPASKAWAMELLRDHHRPATIVYVGDDKTDEEAFAMLGPDDVAIKVGAGPTAADHRLLDTESVVDWLRLTASALR